MFRTLCIFLISSVPAFSADTLVKRTQMMMGTYASISLAQEKLPLSNLAFDRIKKVEIALSSYDKEAEIYRLNHLHQTEISPDTYEALSLCKEYFEQSRGYFDITIGSITKGLFHFGEDERIPTRKELLEAKVDFKGLHFTKQRAWTDEGVTVDLGGMGKGFGVDKAVELLKEKGVTQGIVALSGDIFCLHECKMSIQDPFSDGILASFTMAENNTAISTSGNYRRYVKDTRYNHLINPKTRSSQKRFASITLISQCRSNSDLDAYATAASVMPGNEAFAFLNSLNNVGYLVITNEKKMVINKAFRSLTKGLKVNKIDGALTMKPFIYLPKNY